jgi:2-haloacid dehalogenase
MAAALPNVSALVFDVFGTCVDWRGSIVAAGRVWSDRWGRDADWPALADAWRALYQPAMERVRSGRRPWTDLDVLHRESLLGLLPRFGLNDLSAERIDEMVRIWHRLSPWPDTVPGLARLKRRYTIAPLSNGHVALLTAMAKRAGLPWDCILSAELADGYKPEPRVYLTAARLLRLEPSSVAMVAAHNADLAAARSCGLRTAFVRRPSEHGPRQTTDLNAESDWDAVVDGFEELAERLGA